MTLALAYCAVDALISLLLLEPTRTCLITSLSSACGLFTHYSLCLQCLHHSSLPISFWYLFKCHSSKRLFLTRLYKKKQAPSSPFTPLSCFIFHHLTYNYLSTVSLSLHGGQGPRTVPATYRSSVKSSQTHPNSLMHRCLIKNND